MKLFFLSFFVCACESSLYMPNDDTGTTTNTDTTDTDTDTDSDADSDSDSDSDADADADSDADADTDTDIAYCHVQWPCSITMSLGETPETVYGIVYKEGSTLGVGQGPGVMGQVGYGSKASGPESWTNWADAQYNTDADGKVEGDKSNDEYMGSFPSPTTAGVYGYAFRFSSDGSNWLYCDLGGTGCGGYGSADGYDANDSGTVTVE